MGPLVGVRISLVLDTTAWHTGPYATPPVVTRMLSAMFDLADALGALQHAVRAPGADDPGTWHWTLLHMGSAWGAVLLATERLAAAVARHVTSSAPAARRGRRHSSGKGGAAAKTMAELSPTAAEVLRCLQEVQHARFEFFQLQRSLRRLVHAAVVSDPGLSERDGIAASAASATAAAAGVAAAQDKAAEGEEGADDGDDDDGRSHDHGHLDGHLRYGSCVYATAKVLDRVTAVARCALEV